MLLCCWLITVTTEGMTLAIISSAERVAMGSRVGVGVAVSTGMGVTVGVTVDVAVLAARASRSEPLTQSINPPPINPPTTPPTIKAMKRKVKNRQLLGTIAIDLLLVATPDAAAGN